MAVRPFRMPPKWCSMALKVTPPSDSAVKAGKLKDKSYKLARLIGRSHFQVSDLFDGRRAVYLCRSPKLRKCHLARRRGDAVTDGQLLHDV